MDNGVYIFTSSFFFFWWREVKASLPLPIRSNDFAIDTSKEAKRGFSSNDNNDEKEREGGGEEGEKTTTRTQGFFFFYLLTRRGRSLVSYVVP